jgi:isoleucyl-tRNA synthetase
MSKSRGNVVEPWDVIDAHGADAFRWYYFTAQQPWAGYRFSTETLGETVHRFFTTLWNTYSFWVLYANAEGLDTLEMGEVPPGEGTELDRWALSRLQGVVGEVIQSMDAFDCTTAGRTIGEYVDELSNWYVRLSRRRFWEGDRAAFATLRHCLLTVSALLAPFVPFLADEIYTNLVGGEGEAFGELTDSVHLTDFPEPAAAHVDRELEADVEAALRAIELGRAARSHGEVKNRQPLRKAVIVARGAEREAIERLEGLVKTELNVKELEFVSEEAELVHYDVKPNYRSLGPRFGKLMPQAAAAIEALDPSSVADAITGERKIGVNVDGKDHELEPEDLSLVMRPLDGYRVEAESGRAVALALELDDELLREGLAREIVHAVQNARRDAGLEVTDRIGLVLGGDSELLDAARAHEAYVAGETLATTVGYDGETAGSATEIDGRDLRIGLERAG